MSELSHKTLSVVVPVHNEQAGLVQFHGDLLSVLGQAPLKFEILYCNDGSTDKSVAMIQDFCRQDPRVRLLSLTRNFGKEIATTAGIHEAKGDAILTIDADGQHPVQLIPTFVASWQEGNLVVIGRRKNRQASLTKRLGSRLFYTLFRKVTGMKLDADSSDFRLIDRRIQVEFNRMTERNRITRGLIDWLGYPPVYVTYEERSRIAGDAGYSFGKLMKLALDSMVSLSLSPLYLVAYIGIIVLPLSLLVGLTMLVNVLLGDPLNLHATASAYVIVFMLFLVGVLLVSQGIIGLYLSHIHTETQNRPLYVIDTNNSVLQHGKNS